MALARQALLHYLVLHGLAQSKPSGLAQACTKQDQIAIDGAGRLVWPEPQVQCTACSEWHAHLF